AASNSRPARKRADPEDTKAECGAYASLHVHIVGATAAFGGNPGDVLRRVFYIASFTMNAVLGVDLKPNLRLFLACRFAACVRIPDYLVNRGRAVALRRFPIFRQIDGNG